jgi:molecular chaperone DnaJ
MSTRDFYEVLGVSRDASADEIKRSYRRLAQQLHPDRKPDDPEAESHFKELAVAYETLGDPERRRRYDLFGVEGSHAAGGDPFGGGLGDIFDAFFGGASPFGGGGSSGPPRGVDLEVVAEIQFEEAVFGTQSRVEVRTAVACEPCESSGAEAGSHPRACAECNGTGQVRTVRQSILGQMVTSGACRACGGTGRVIDTPCVACGGEGRSLETKAYTVDIPAGVETGSTLRLRGHGAVGPRGGAAGDLYVHLRVHPHERFERQGDDLVEHLHIPFTQAALGAERPYETLDGTEVVTVPPGTQSGDVFRLRGLGVARRRGRGRGDILVQVIVDVPDRLDDEQEQLLRRLAELRGDEVAPPESGLMSRIRSAFK